MKEVLSRLYEGIPVNVFSFQDISTEDTDILSCLDYILFNYKNSPHKFAYLADSDLLIELYEYITDPLLNKNVLIVGAAKKLSQDINSPISYYHTGWIKFCIDANFNYCLWADYRWHNWEYWLTEKDPDKPYSKLKSGSFFFEPREDLLTIISI